MLHSKFWQAFFALAPLFGFVLIFIGYGVFMFSIFGNMEQMQHSGQPPAEFFSGMGFFFFMIFLMVVLALASLIFYIVHAAQNPNLKQNNLLIVWILLFIFANGIGQLVYWIVEIISKRNNSPTTY